MQRSLLHHSHTSHIGIASNLPTTAYVKMIDIFMIFTMTVPLMEIIGHTYGESLRMEISDLSDHPKAPHGLGSPPGSVSIQPLGLDDSKLDLPQIKSTLFANDKRSECKTKGRRLGSQKDKIFLRMSHKIEIFSENS